MTNLTKLTMCLKTLMRYVCLLLLNQSHSIDLFVSAMSMSPDALTTTNTICFFLNLNKKGIVT